MKQTILHTTFLATLIISGCGVLCDAPAYTYNWPPGTGCWVGKTFLWVVTDQGDRIEFDENGGHILTRSTTSDPGEKGFVYGTTVDGEYVEIAVEDVARAGFGT